MKPPLTTFTQNEALSATRPGVFCEQPLSSVAGEHSQWPPAAEIEATKYPRRWTISNVDCLEASPTRPEPRAKVPQCMDRRRPRDCSFLQNAPSTVGVRRAREARGGRGQLACNRSRSPVGGRRHALAILSFMYLLAAGASQPPRRSRAGHQPYHDWLGADAPGQFLRHNLV
eukprot:scaffold707_cov399-Prasinococcus_capsulatus_cf.AAC.5